MWHHVVWQIVTNISEEPTASVLTIDHGDNKFLPNISSSLSSYAVSHYKGKGKGKGSVVSVLN
jgi:hypothetical protein